MAYTTNPDGSITFRDPGNPVNGQMVTIPAGTAQSMPASYWTQITRSPEDKMSTYQGLTNDADRSRYLALPGNSDLANTVRANYAPGQAYNEMQTMYDTRNGQDQGTSLAGGNNLALSAPAAANASANPSYSAGTYAPTNGAFMQGPNGPVTGNNSTMGVGNGQGGMIDGGSNPYTVDTGAPKVGVGNNASTNAAGQTFSSDDIAQQNQLRQTAMQSPMWNPGGANTYGIQNSSINNLNGAFGGGVIPSTPSSGPPPGSQPIDGGSNSYNVNYGNDSQTIPITTSTGGPYVGNTGGTTTQPVVQGGAMGQQMGLGGANQAVNQMLGSSNTTDPNGMRTSTPSSQASGQAFVPQQTNPLQRASTPFQMATGTGLNTAAPVSRSPSYFTNPGQFANVRTSTPS